MKFRIVAVFLVAGSLTLGCGADDKPELVQDQVAFVAPGSDTVLRMNIDGTNVKERTGSPTTSKAWPNQSTILNNICEAGSNNPNLPIELVSPDGAPLGPLDDSWIPEWSPDGTQIAVACGRDFHGDGHVVVVTDVEKESDRPGWSRTRPGKLSSRIEIYLVTPDASSLTRLTSNQAGDWLPRWHPSGKYLLIESNRDGNSEIYQLSTDSTEIFRVTRQEADDQAPVWSRDGYSIAFASNATGDSSLGEMVLLLNNDFEVHVAIPGLGESSTTGRTGRPVPWRN